MKHHLPALTAPSPHPACPAASGASQPMPSSQRGTKAPRTNLPHLCSRESIQGLKVYQGHCKQERKINRHRISQQTSSPEKRSHRLWVLLLLFALSWHRYGCSLHAGSLNTPETCTLAVTLPNPFFSKLVLAPSVGKWLCHSLGQEIPPGQFGPELPSLILPSLLIRMLPTAHEGVPQHLQRCSGCAGSFTT